MELVHHQILAGDQLGQAKTKYERVLWHSLSHTKWDTTRNLLVTFRFTCTKQWSSFPTVKVGYFQELAYVCNSFLVVQNYEVEMGFMFYIHRILWLLMFYRLASPGKRDGESGVEFPCFWVACVKNLLSNHHHWDVLFPYFWDLLFNDSKGNLAKSFLHRHDSNILWD